MWDIIEEGFDKEHVVSNGNKFMTGNGYMGYRGTLEEYRKEDFVACNIAGLYDRVADKWREPINAPNGLYTVVIKDGNELNSKNLNVVAHMQSLDIKTGIHRRKTEFTINGSNVSIEAERFVSLANIHLLCMKYMITADKNCQLTIRTGIDGNVWDINGPHLENFSFDHDKECLSEVAYTHEGKHPIAVSEGCSYSFNSVEEIEQVENSIYRNITFTTYAAQTYTIYKYSSVFHANDDVKNVNIASKEAVLEALNSGYEEERDKHEAMWRKRWEMADVIIEGSREDQLALRYSIYHLNIIAPAHSKNQSIPARGLSGQTYKGAIFWDTEMFMLPFFLYTAPETARSLINYRIATLGGAKEKAAYYGYKGAFYAWESHEGGLDACSDYNVTDVFTGRPVKTYFRDKQVHISAAVVYAIWETYMFTGDVGILINGGAEVILECARFYYSYAYYKEDKDRYEILDVIGPDEYHERVNNNAYTSKMVYHTIDVALKVCEILSKEFNAEYNALLEKIGHEDEILKLKRFREKLYVPMPNDNNLVIEQFDGYERLEDCSVEQVRSRLISPKEYWGGGHGVASTTKVIKQADVVLMLYLFKDEYSQEIKKANWTYYEPRTEHGSSLSPCIYSLLSCDIGNVEFAYPYFVKSANIDLTGESKQFAGDIYIGGTHPAANGGTWMSVIFGFAGLSIQEGKPVVKPMLPNNWERLKFKVIVRGIKYSIDITKNNVEIVEC